MHVHQRHNYVFIRMEKRCNKENEKYFQFLVSLWGGDSWFRDQRQQKSRNCVFFSRFLSSVFIYFFNFQIRYLVICSSERFLLDIFMDSHGLTFSFISNSAILMKQSGHIGPTSLYPFHQSIAVSQLASDLDKKINCIFILTYIIQIQPSIEVNTWIYRPINIY